VAPASTNNPALRTQRLRGLVKNTSVVVLSALAYYLCAQLSYAWTIQPAGVVIVWFPSGLMLAVLALLNKRQWPLALAGAFVGNVTADVLHGTSVPMSLAGGLANGVESLVAAWVLVRSVGAPAKLANLREVAVLVVGAAGLSNAVTALAGALVVVYGTDMTFWTAWFVWWTGDGIGMLTVAPAILTTVSVATRQTQMTKHTVVEAAILFATLVTLAQLFLSHTPNQTAALSPDPYMLIPLLFWAAIRFGLPGATLATLVLCFVTVWNAAHGIGPFAQAEQSPTNEVLRIYAYLALASLSSLVPASILSERTAGERMRARLAAILDAAPDFVTIGQMDGPPLYINRAARRALGLGETEPVESLLAFRRPGFNDFLRSVVFPTAIRDGSWRGEAEYIARSGQVIPVSQVSIVHLDASGKVAFLSTISRDIADRLRMEEALRVAEERVRFALEVAEVGIWEANLKTGVLYWSGTCERMHGLARGTFRGTFEAFLDCIAADDRRQVAEQIERATREHTDSEVEYQTVWPDGTVRLIAMTGHTVYDETGAPIRAAGAALDVTEQRSLENQLRQAQKMEAVGQLAGGVAHDFNNLLTAILGYAEFVLDDLPADDPNRKGIEQISQAGRRAAQLTQQLLAFSRKQMLAPRVLRVGDVVSGVIPLLRRLLGEAIDLRTAMGDRWHAMADPGQIEQVVVNLAVNARDAMPDGGRLTIETADVWLDDAYVKQHPMVSPGPHVMIAVSDTGHGMDAVTQKRIFEPFFTTKAKGKGTGLGLATVYGIVKQSGGYIWVYSEPGHGTTFKVYLPRTAELEAPPERQPVATSIAGGDETILVVEDEDGVRELASTVLTRHGYTVLAAATPRQGIELADAHQNPIHLVLTDVVLPEISGRAMVTEIQRRHPEPRILYMSGYTDDAVVHHGVLDSGMSFLQKPFTGGGLLRKVRELLDVEQT